MSSTLASLGRLMVLLMAPEMNGWAAAIMRMCPWGAMNRLPYFPHLLAQSNTGRCSVLRCGAPSTVCLPQITSLSASICFLLSPSSRSRLNE